MQSKNYNIFFFIVNIKKPYYIKGRRRAVAERLTTNATVVGLLLGTEIYVIFPYSGNKTKWDYSTLSESKLCQK